MGRLSQTDKSISAYVDSQGETLPKDWQRFTEGKDFDKQCIFCTASINRNLAAPVLKYTIRVVQGRQELDPQDVGLKSCNKCHLKVKNGFDLKRVSTNLPPILQNYIHTGELERDNLELYFTWRKHREYQDSRSDRCVFCDTVVPSNSKDTLELSVQFNNDKYIGGDVRICPTCIKTSPLIFSKYSGGDKCHTSSICGKCNKTYYLSELESRHRRDSLGNDKHYHCPDCVAETQSIHKLNDVRVGRPNNAFPRNNLVRFIYKNCSFCVGRIIVDISWSDKRAKFLQHSDGKHLICAKCKAIEEYLLDIEHTFVIHINNYILALFEKDATEWTYTVIDKSDHETRELEVKHTKTLKMEDAISLLYTDKTLFPPDGELF